MIPCCFHPTRVVIIADSQQSLTLLSAPSTKSHMTYEGFNNPYEALHYINDVYQPEPFYDRYMINEDSVANSRRLGAHVIDTHSEIYRPQRFEQISTVVLDYSSIDSTSVNCSPLAALHLMEKIENPHIQRILLVEEKETQFVTQAYNGGLIQHCISKLDTDWEEQFYEALYQSQWQYFNTLSEVFMKKIQPHNAANQAFNDPNFQAFFKAIISNHGFTEAYLCETTGSYLFLNSQAQDHGLVVNIAEQLDYWVRSGQAKGINIPLLKELKNRKKMMCYHASYGASQPDTSHWEIYAHPAKTFKGQTNTFYYAFAPNLYDIDLERILPFEEYRDNHQQRRASRLH